MDGNRTHLGPLIRTPQAVLKFGGRLSTAFRHRPWAIVQRIGCQFGCRATSARMCLSPGSKLRCRPARAVPSPSRAQSLSLNHSNFASSGVAAFATTTTDRDVPSQRPRPMSRLPEGNAGLLRHWPGMNGSYAAGTDNAANAGLKAASGLDVASGNGVVAHLAARRFWHRGGSIGLGR